MAVYGKEFAAVYNAKWAFWGPKMWPFLKETVARSVPQARTWLDLCCGAGSLLKFVCKSGFAATGVDRSRYQIAHARRNAPCARLIVGDILHLSLRERFDVVTCMFDSLNYLTRKADLLRAFRRARRHVKPNGIFVFDMNTFEGLQDQWCKTTARHERDLSLSIETSFDPTRALGRCVITGFVREGRLYRRFREEHVERGYRAGEIEDLLEKAGFSFRKRDGNRFGRPRKRSGRLLYVCRRQQRVTRRKGGARFVTL